MFAEQSGVCEAPTSERDTTKAQHSKGRKIVMAKSSCPPLEPRSPQPPAPASRKSGIEALLSYAYGPQPHNLKAERSAAPVTHTNSMKPLLERAPLSAVHVAPLRRERALHRKMWQWCGSTGTESLDALPSDGAGFGEIVRGEPVVACVPRIRRRVFSLSPHRPVLCSHWQKVRICSRRMTAQLNVDVRFAHTITAPGCPVETWLEGFEGADSLQRMMSVPWTFNRSIARMCLDIWKAREEPIAVPATRGVVTGLKSDLLVRHPY